MEFPKHHLSLTIKESSSNSYTEIVLSNTNHEREKKTHQRRIIFVFISYLIFLFSFERHYLGVHIAFILILGIVVIRLFGLVDKEVLKVVKDFGIEKSVVFAFNRNRQSFIPSNNIYKVVINEVIYFNRIIYVLQLLTASESNETPPVLILYDMLLPPLKCLEKVFDILNVMVNS